MNVIERIKQQAKKPYPLAKIETEIYAANFLLILSGLSLSVSFKSWLYFELCGSLIVIAGIAVAWEDMTGRFDRLENMVSSSLKLELFNLTKNKSTGILDDVTKIVREGEIDEDSEQVKELFELLRLRIRAFEAITLILGTFIWGVGSATLELIYKFDA